MGFNLGAFVASRARGKVVCAAVGAHPVTRPEVLRSGPARGGLRRSRARLPARLAPLALEARGPGGKVVRTAAGADPVAGAEVTCGLDWVKQDARESQVRQDARESQGKTGC